MMLLISPPICYPGILGCKIPKREKLYVPIIVRSSHKNQEVINDEVDIRELFSCISLRILPC